jgi:hypothetical protein
MPAVLPSGLEVFIDEVVPLLVRRGLFQSEYTGITLREHYGRPCPTPSRTVHSAAAKAVADGCCTARRAGRQRAGVVTESRALR